MEKTFTPKATLSMKAVEANQVMAQCAEPMCRITIWVDAKEQDKEHKCISCTMRENLK